MEPRHVSVSALAEATDYSRQHLSDVVNGHARMEPRLAARIGKVMGTSTGLWLNLQAKVDSWEAEKEAEGWTPQKTWPDADAGVREGPVND